MLIQDKRAEWGGAGYRINYSGDEGASVFPGHFSPEVKLWILDWLQDQIAKHAERFAYVKLSSSSQIHANTLLKHEDVKSSEVLSYVYEAEAGEIVKGKEQDFEEYVSILYEIREGESREEALDRILSDSGIEGVTGEPEAIETPYLPGGAVRVNGFQDLIEAHKEQGAEFDPLDSVEFGGALVKAEHQQEDAKMVNQIVRVQGETFHVSELGGAEKKESLSDRIVKAIKDLRERYKDRLGAIIEDKFPAMYRNQFIGKLSDVIFSHPQSGIENDTIRGPPDNYIVLAHGKGRPRIIYIEPGYVADEPDMMDEFMEVVASKGRVSEEEGEEGIRSGETRLTAPFGSINGAFDHDFANDLIREINMAINKHVAKIGVDLSTLSPNELFTVFSLARADVNQWIADHVEPERRFKVEFNITIADFTDFIGQDLQLDSVTAEESAKIAGEMINATEKLSKARRSMKEPIRINQNEGDSIRLYRDNLDNWKEIEREDKLDKAYRRWRLKKTLKEAQRVVEAERVTFKAGGLAVATSIGDESPFERLPDAFQFAQAYLEANVDEIAQVVAPESNRFLIAQAEYEPSELGADILKVTALTDNGPKHFAVRFMSKNYSDSVLANASSIDSIPSPTMPSPASPTPALAKTRLLGNWSYRALVAFSAFRLIASKNPESKLLFISRSKFLMVSNAALKTFLFKTLRTSDFSPSIPNLCANSEIAVSLK